MSQGAFISNRLQLRLVQQIHPRPRLAGLPPDYHVVACVPHPEGWAAQGYCYVRPDSLPTTTGAGATLFDRLGNAASYVDLGALVDQADPRFTQLLAGAGQSR